MTRILAPRALRYVLLGCAVLGTVFLFLLATASANTELFASNYNLLLVLNGVMVALLMGLVGYQLWRLRKNLKAGVFGSRLAIRLVLLFALVAVLPGALLYGVSVQFLGKSIESWFDVRVDEALKGGLNLGRGAPRLSAEGNDQQGFAARADLAGRQRGQHGAAAQSSE